jgi:hypothetical protein
MRAALLALACVTSGCAADLTDASLVEGLRLLGVQAEPPEAQPGDAVTLQAWVVDTHGRAITVDWSYCTLPSNGLANPACITGSDGVVALGSGTSLDINLPTVSRDQLGPADASDGIYLPIVVHVRVDGDRVDGIYRFRIQGDEIRNNNPIFKNIEGLDVPMMPPNQAPQPTHQGQVWTLGARYTNPEIYVIPSTGATVTETLTTQWFATAGTFADAVSGGLAYDGFTIDRKLPPRGGKIDLWAVGHDERGGTVMTHRSFVME